MSRVADWSAAQDAMLRRMSHLSDADLSLCISLIGPVRTARAVEERRRRMRIAERAPPLACEEEGLSADGWPVLFGTAEERDAAFVRALLEAQLARVRTHP